MCVSCFTCNKAIGCTILNFKLFALFRIPATNTGLPYSYMPATQVLNDTQSAGSCFSHRHESIGHPKETSPGPAPIGIVPSNPCETAMPTFSSIRSRFFHFHASPVGFPVLVQHRWCRLASEMSHPFGSHVPKRRARDLARAHVETRIFPSAWNHIAHNQITSNISAFHHSHQLASPSPRNLSTS